MWATVARAASTEERKHSGSQSSRWTGMRRITPAAPTTQGTDTATPASAPTPSHPSPGGMKEETGIMLISSRTTARAILAMH